MFRFLGSACGTVPAGKRLSFCITFFLTLFAGSAVAGAAPSAAQVVRVRGAAYQAVAQEGAPHDTFNAKRCAAVASLTGCFDESGAHFTGESRLSLQLVAWGRAGALTRVSAVRPVVRANQVRYRHGPLTAWWRVLPSAFEQGFTITQRRTGSGALILVLAGSQRSVQAGEEIAWQRLRYGGLKVTDALGKTIPASLRSAADRVLIAVNDTHAVYPLTVDPLVWVAQKVTAAGDTAGSGFGSAEAISGTTAVIGAMDATVNGHADQGAAYIFDEAGGVWTQATELSANDGAANDEFGVSVLISGTTAVVGAPGATVNGNAGQGAVYVFSDSGGTWTQTAKLTAGDGTAGNAFGTALALSGTTLVVGAPSTTVGGNADQGTVYVFDESGATWAQVAELQDGSGNSGADFGISVGISGTNLLVGAPSPSSGSGKVFVFTGSGSAWTQADVLVPSGTVSAAAEFGNAIAVSGNTALIGEFNDITDVLPVGAAYIFAGSGGNWTQVTELVNPAPGDYFGSAVALSGTTALVGAELDEGSGEAFMYSGASGTWSLTATFVDSGGNDDDGFGSSVALSDTTALVGTGYPGTTPPDVAYFESYDNLALAVSAPQSVSPGQQLQNQVIVTNDGSTTSAPLPVTLSVPSATTLISATTADGSCATSAGIINCALNPVAANGGTATINVTLQEASSGVSSIENTASILSAPPVAASATTAVSATPVASATPTALSFSSQTVGAASPGQTVTLTNTGSASLTNVVVSISGSNAGDFSEISSCPATLPDTAGSNSCAIAVTFNPQAAGAASANLVITSNATGSPNTIALSGSGEGSAPPPPQPAPTPPTSGGHSGGGGAFGLFGLLLLVPLVGFRKRRA